MVEMNRQVADNLERIISTLQDSDAAPPGEGSADAC
jgi:hypothetical protein